MELKPQIHFLWWAPSNSRPTLNTAVPYTWWLVKKKKHFLFIKQIISMSNASLSLALFNTVDCHDNSYFTSPSFRNMHTDWFYVTFLQALWSHLVNSRPGEIRATTSCKEINLSFSTWAISNNFADDFCPRRL